MVARIRRIFNLPDKLPDEKLKYVGLGRNYTFIEIGRKYAYEQVFAF